ncbi:MAG TPA: DNA topoisomerase I [Steroidobacteraceae bacterium]|nr:DNA topoisomerase I [Steroidobacteraceae bacterium]
MTRNVVIVESPAKAKTIKKYLGKDFEVMASYGHVRDLVPKEGAVDPARKFAMRWEIIDKNRKHVDAIARAVKKADALYLSTDPDREGEAISWHLYELLKDSGALDGKSVHRSVFYEITRNAVQEAVEQPREISQELVKAYLARRALDYLVGFNLSPLLWKKAGLSGASAGRVQSPALRMICEREEEIAAFVAREYWTIDAQAEKDAQQFGARLTQFRGEKVEQFTITTAARADEVRGALNQAAAGNLTVANVDRKQRKRNPAPPFTTSTLQQEAARKLGFGAQRTMRVAQRLYEGMDFGEGPIGLITYMRTDSVNLAVEAVREIRSTIARLYGAEALPDAPRTYRTKSKNAQEAHEAVRPTSPSHTPEQLAGKLDGDELKLYTLIWRRAVASQMEAAVFDTVAVDLEAGEGHAFRANGSTLITPGFLAVYRESFDDAASDDENDRMLPAMQVGDRVRLLEIRPEQHFTEPPPRYSEASLVKTLEEHGIGRPSTYASIIQTLLYKKYCELLNKRFVPTDLGKIVNRFLTGNFERYVDYGFTAEMEDELDNISRGEEDWVPVLERFWEALSAQIADVDQNVTRQDVSMARDIGIDPASGKPVSVRYGRYGAFAQIGTREDEEKPKFASLRPHQRMDTITLPDALELFLLPRVVGQTDDGHPIKVAIGRFGPYVQFAPKKYASLKADDDPYTITLERARELIREKLAIDANRIIREFPEAGIQVLNGRYGPYITDGKRNGRIPKDRDPKSLTLEECKALLEAAPPRRGRWGRKTPSADKAPAAEVPSTAAGEPLKPKAATRRRAKAPPAVETAASKPARATVRAAAKPAARKKAPRKRASRPAVAKKRAGAGDD